MKVSCLVCGGAGFVKAAPVQVTAEWTGSNPIPAHTARTSWDDAVVVPCFACTPPTGRPT
ncbi:hypothetical protein A5784_34930 [Mycobacterium sp. 852013-50091_SCH5140682]|uniref:hypothetical protein n=1 Tax=Mycobacterium sp. 852013-50091_SCH5140682 TaxID=1834109 RepID=UPI0007EA2AA1|nr:hypothetical protein [Mycobacterium sp. 852013-50091_SCH5140682]OBC11395.1 hypothetical protein A5784_34930 [Mycobacterium sp. 852013-50091_SCH5140682]